MIVRLTPDSGSSSVGLVRPDDLPTRVLEEQVPAALLEPSGIVRSAPGAELATARLQSLGLRLAWLGAGVVPLLGALWVVNTIGGPFTLIVAALLLGLSTAVFGWAVGRLRLSEGMQALAQDRLHDALLSFNALVGAAERHRPRVIVLALLGRAEAHWRLGDRLRAQAALDEAEAHIRRADGEDGERIDEGVRRLLFARQAQLAAVLGELERARSWLAALERLEPASTRHGALERHHQLVRTTRWLIAFHADPDASVELGPTSDDAPVSLLERALLAWVSDRCGDAAPAQALRDELIAIESRRALMGLRVRTPRLAAWIEGLHASRKGYR